MTRIIIDCDPGVDDALAIILALHHPEIQVEALCTVTGNSPLAYTTKNGLNILALCEREDIPLYKGSATALDMIQPETVPEQGDDGLGGYADTIASNNQCQEEYAVDFLVRKVKEQPKELTIVAIGPCTNIALAIQKDPDFVKNVKKIVIMGGAKYTGNMSPVAEYNFWADPQAAKQVFNAGFEENVMVGLDVTNKIALSGDVREILRIIDTKLSNFIYNITKVGLDSNWKFRRKPVSPMHDVLTIAYLIDESILTLEDAAVDIVTEGIGKGQSIVDINGNWRDGRCNAKYASKVDVNKFYKVFLTTIFKEHADALNEYLDKQANK